jgi:hypothetical protein
MMGVRVRHISIGRIRDGIKAIQSYISLEENKVKGAKLAMQTLVYLLWGHWLLRLIIVYPKVQGR